LTTCGRAPISRAQDDDYDDGYDHSYLHGIIAPPPHLGGFGARFCMIVVAAAG
jgi:hypothetical protein